MYDTDVPHQLQQGVLVQGAYFWGIDQTCLGLALTPACDFEQGKVELLTFCAVLEALPVIRRLVEGDLTDDAGNPATKVSNNKLGRVRSTIDQMIKRRRLRYHWLAPLPDQDSPLVADFTILMSMPLEEADTLVRVAQLASPYKEEAAARYAAYLGRVGIPDFEGQQVAAWTDGIVNELLPDQFNDPPR